MTRPPVALPDAEVVLTGWLRAELGGTRVVTALPGNLEQVLPVVQVTRIGGGRQQYLLDRPRLDFDCYALSREQARDLAGTVESMIAAMRGVTTGGATVGSVEIEVGVSWRPDWNERVRRYGGTAVLTIRAA